MAGREVDGRQHKAGGYSIVAAGFAKLSRSTAGSSRNLSTAHSGSYVARMGSGSRTPDRRVERAVRAGGATSSKPGIRRARVTRAIAGSGQELMVPTGAEVQRLALDLGRMIEDARRQVARAANAALTTLYWQLGKHLHANVLAGRRAEYGAQVVTAVGRQLEVRHGRGFGEKNLRRMIQFVEAFPDPEIVATLRRQWGWAQARSMGRTAAVRGSP